MRLGKCLLLVPHRYIMYLKYQAWAMVAHAITVTARSINAFAPASTVNMTTITPLDAHVLVIRAAQHQVP